MKNTSLKKDTFILLIVILISTLSLYGAVEYHNVVEKSDLVKSIGTSMQKVKDKGGFVHQ